MEEDLEVYDQSRIDTYIWRHVGRKPVSEIAKEVGVKPEEILRRKNELLESVDVLTIQQKRQKLLMELDEMAARAREKAETIGSEFYAGTINASVSAIKAVLGELNRMEKTDQGALDRLNQQRIQELLRLVDTTVSSTFDRVAAQHKLEKDDLMEIFQEELMESAREIG